MGIINDAPALGASPMFLLPESVSSRLVQHKSSSAGILKYPGEETKYNNTIIYMSDSLASAHVYSAQRD